MFEKDFEKGELSNSDKVNASTLKTNIAFFQPKKVEALKMPLLDEIVNIIKKEGGLSDLSNTLFIGVQHILKTTLPLFDALIELGALPNNMYFSGKCYSTSDEAEQALVKRGIHLMPNNKPRKPGEYEEYCQEGIQKMWAFFGDDIKEKKVDQIVVVDEGGRCLENMPDYIKVEYKVAAIEQTRAGLYSEVVNSIPFPLIDVASCAAKKLLEPPLIATAIIGRLKALLEILSPDKGKTVFGVVGNGAIGNAICRYLLSMGYKVIVYDQEQSAFQNFINRNFYRVDSIEKVMVNADIIFGCTGKDITKDIDVLSLIKKDRVFISCTSEDKEFRSLLRIIAHQDLIPVDPLSDITCLTKNGRKILILRGGYPFNFDRTHSSVPAQDIQLTRGLILVACLQAVTSATKMIGDGVTVNNQGGRIALDPIVQSFVATKWIDLRLPEGEKAKYNTLFSNNEWIQKNSSGQFIKNDFLWKIFHLETREHNYSLTPLSKL